MSDRMFASEGDSRGPGRPDPPLWAGPWESRAGRPADEGEDATAGVARRLQGRLDRHGWLLERMQSDPLQPEPPGLQELLDTTRRMRRDATSLLLICAQEPSAAGDAPRRLRDVLADAAATAEEPRRVDVRPGPAATLTAGAATELVHLLAELLDHVTAVYPGARVDVASRVEEPAGVVVEVRADGAARHDPDGLGGRSALAAAERIAQRSRGGIALRRAATAPGSVATVHCPATAVTLEQPERPSRSWARDAPDGPRDIPLGDGHGATNGRTARNGGTATNGYGDTSGYGDTNGHRPGRRSAAPIDELFGPLIDLPHELEDGGATPIFEAIASAWFRDEAPAPGTGSGADALDWQTPSDPEWQAAAERAAQPDPLPVTSSGLPRRRPGNQLVPPRRSRVAEPEPAAAERVPDRVRERLSTYQRGLRQGRHRAEPALPDPDPGTAGAW